MVATSKDGLGEAFLMFWNTRAVISRGISRLLVAGLKIMSPLRTPMCFGPSRADN